MSLRGVRVFLQQKERRTGMNRIFSLILTLALLLTALVGCGRPGKLVGTWSGSTDVTELIAAMLAEQTGQSAVTLDSKVEIPLVLTFERGGTYRMSFDTARVLDVLSDVVMGYKENRRQVFYSQMSDGYSAEELDKTIKETTGMSMDAYLDAYLKEQIEQMSQTLKDGVLKNPEETGVYVEDGDRVQLTPQGEASVSCRFTVSGDTLTLEMQQKDMALTLNLTKQ